MTTDQLSHHHSTLLFAHRRKANLESVTMLRQCLSKALDTTMKATAQKNNILLCFSEWATNLIQHASPMTEDIDISIEKQSDVLVLKVLDTGQSWNPTLTDEKSIITEFSDAEEGRGIALIQTYCDDLHYETVDGVNKLTMSWKIVKTVSKSRVLIVDDDPLLLKVYDAYLNKDLDITCARSGDQALELIENNKFDLIISDIQMPNMGGMELRKAIQEAHDGRSIPFIFLTALSEENVQANANHLGIDDYLIKPVDKKSLLFSAQRVLARSNQVYNQLSHRLDEKITNSLLPKISKPKSGWNIEIRQRTTGCGGGDFLLSKRFEKENLYVLADVMGHDVSAKFFAYAYAGYLRGLLHSTTTASPTDTLNNLSNSAFEDQLLSQITLTSCAFSLLDNDQIEMASAGHPCPLLITDKGIESVPVQGMLPGLLHHSGYSSTQIQLGEGKRIAVFTDGLFESGDSVTEREQLTIEIEKTLLETLRKPIDVAIDEVMRVFDVLAGTPAKDDTLLILIESKCG
ncbi:response regulator [Vibrio penaeicida]|uniref:response regulator n=1 Tax=Vibrio penaeicida TaxID=104609 RepID=UPI002733BC7F|nr:response regulator [Vibrio penaeicida]MDP2574641.1 response regulator [Vibrio penaeicida]